MEALLTLCFTSHNAITLYSPACINYEGISMTKFNNQELISNYPNCSCINPKLNSNKPILYVSNRECINPKLKDKTPFRVSCSQSKCRKAYWVVKDITRKGRGGALPSLPPCFATIISGGCNVATHINFLLVWPRSQIIPAVTVRPAAALVWVWL